MKKIHNIYILFLVFLTISSLTINSNYAFQLTKVNAGDSVPLGPVEFKSFALAADTYQYIDATYAETYGTVAADPPLGMGVDDTTTTNMTEGSYTEYSYTQLEYAGFSSAPSGWGFLAFEVVSGYVLSDATPADRQIVTKEYNLASWAGARLTAECKAYSVSYPYETNDWELKYVDDGGTHLIRSLIASNGQYYISEVQNVLSTDTGFQFMIDSGTADINERLKTDDWYIYGITANTYYRFEAVFKFTDVGLGLASYALYIDFYPALSGSDDLDFSIGITTDPTNKVAPDKQDDFNVVVTSYITASTVYLKVADTYRSGDTSQTTAYIARCYLYTPEETVGWYDNDWIYRKQISVTEQAGAGTNYQIPINVYYNDSTKDIAGSVDCEALCQLDFDDIRFTASNGTTLLDYWVEFNVSTTYAKFWVEVKADVSSTASDVKIFTYFGNDAVADVSSGDNTFLFFDDFNDASLNTTKWYTWLSGGSTTESDGVVHVVGGATAQSLGGKTEVGVNTAFYGYIKMDEQATISLGVDERSSDGTATGNYDCADVLFSTAKYWRTANEGTQGTTARTDVLSSYSRLTIARNGATDTRFFIDSTLKATLTAQIPDDDMGVFVYSAGTDDDAYVDWVCLRKWQVTEPTFAAPANLEYQNIYAPVMNAASYSPLNPTTATGITLFAIVTDADAIDLTVVYFDAIAYPTGFNDSNYYATEVGTNVWTYTFAEDELDAGVYCFKAYATDTQSKFETPATYDLYQTFQVTQAEEDQITCYIVIFDTLGNFVPFETFEVYRNNVRQYTYIFAAYDTEQQNITIVDRWGETLYTNDFDAGTIELVVTVDVYSLKFMSWYNGFAEVNITHGGITYSEIIMPMEVIEFMLYNGSYTYLVDYLNTTTYGPVGIDLTNSTGVIITGNTITDVMAMTDQLWDLVNVVNVTITSTNTQVLTISVDLDNANATINNQLLYVLLNVTNTNTTIYQQTVDLLAAIQNNATLIYNQVAAFIIGVYANQSTIYSQTVSILSQLNLIGSNVTANYISLSSELNLIDSSLASNFTSIIATLSSVGSNITTNYLSLAATLAAIDSSLLANFTSISADLLMIDSSLLSNFTEVTATLSAIGSNVTTDYLALAATLSAIDTNLLSNFTSISAELILIDSNLFSNFTSITSTLTAIGSNITTDYLSLAAILVALDSNVYSNFTSIVSTLSSIGSNITTNYLTLSATLAAIDSSLLSNFTSISSELLLIDSNMFSNFTSIVSTLTAIDSNITANYLSIIAELLSVNSTLYTQTLSIISSLTSVNSTIYAQTITILSYTIDTNQAINLVLDPDTFNLLFADVTFSDEFAHFYIMSSFHNGTVYIYENDVLSSAGVSETDVPILYPLNTAAGTYNLSAKIVSGANTLWFNSSYTVVEAFYISDFIYSPTSERNYLSGFVSLGCNYTVYENDSIVLTGFKGAGSASVDWAKNTTKGFYVWGVKFIYNAITRWVNGTYESDGLILLQLYIGQDNDTIYVSGRLYSTVHSLTYSVWENSGSGDVLMGSGTITITDDYAWFTLSWTKSSENVVANWTLSIDDGSNNATASGFYTKLDAAVTNINNAGVFYDQSTDVQSQTVIEGDLYSGPSPDAAMWQTMGYILTVFFTVFAVGVGYYASKGWSTKRKKHDRSNDWLAARR